MIPAGLICALPAEAKAIAGREIALGTVVQLDPFLIVVTGMGAERAHEGCDRLLASGARSLTSWGTAAALVPALRAGDVVLPATVRYGPQEFETDRVVRQRLLDRLAPSVPAAQGPLVQAERIVRSREDKQRLQALTGASAVDMESGTVGAAAQSAAVPFLVVRSIVDACDVTLPAFVIDAADAYGRPRPGALLAGLLRHPAAILDLFRLGASFRAALAALSAAAPALEAGIRSA